MKEDMSEEIQFYIDCLMMKAAKEKLKVVIKYNNLVDWLFENHEEVYYQWTQDVGEEE
jgi:hypothetical protein